MNFKNKKIWITGASSGIGEALAYEFLKEGAVLILSANRADPLEKVKNNCLEKGGEVYAYAFDLSDNKKVIDTAKQVEKKHGPIFALINNGGISQRSLITETSLEIDRKLMEIDYFGPMALTKMVLPSMIKNGGGHIVAVSSISGKFGFPLRSAYAAAKHAINGFFETLHAENKRDNIHVTIVNPGRVQTNISYRALTKDGLPHGKMDDGQKFGISAEKCARKIIKAIKKKKVEALIGGKELLMVHIKRFFPRFFYKIVSKIKPT